MEKTKKKTIEQSGVRKGSPMEWQEGFKEKLSFEFTHKADLHETRK